MAATAKISVQVWEPLIARLDEKLTEACLRRDAYLAKVLEGEIDHLDAEVSIPNSRESIAVVGSMLETLKRKLVSLTLPVDVIQKLNAVCKRKGIVRDAFFNRLYLLLAAKPKVIDVLLFGDDADTWRADVFDDFKSDRNAFLTSFYPLETAIDPFNWLREGFRHYAEGSEEFHEPVTGQTVRVKRSLNGRPEPLPGVYTVIFDQKVGGQDLRGLSCYLPDWRVPGHAAEKAHQAKLDDLFAELERL